MLLTQSNNTLKAGYQHLTRVRQERTSTSPLATSDALTLFVAPLLNDPLRALGRSASACCNLLGGCGFWSGVSNISPHGVACELVFMLEMPA